MFVKEIMIQLLKRERERGRLISNIGPFPHLTFGSNAFYFWYAESVADNNQKLSHDGSAVFTRSGDHMDSTLNEYFVIVSLP